jgi:cytochrome c peroxidase
MKIKAAFLLFISFLLMGFYSIQEFTFIYPNYFPVPNYNFQKNKLDSSTIELGRALFYDPILSKDSSISCASCHSSFNAFAHTDHNLSHGINDLIGTRNAPALFNLAWQKSFMWDGAINHIDMQALAPISHPKEMDENIEHIVNKLKSTPIYKSLFFNAYHDSLITGERVLKSLSQFQLTLVSANSKYDEVKQGKATFTAQEQNGYLLFLKNCNSCHTEPLFSNYDFANNGLPIDSSLNDYGKGAITLQAEDSLLFKIPSLRNLSYTYPYMHDGRFKKLNQVLNHYTSTILQSKTLSKELKSPIILSTNERVDLVAFLLTLNDKSFVFEPKFQFPKNILLPTEGKEN